MEFARLILGFVLLAAFSWILFRNSKRTGLVHSLLRMETALGALAGLYLGISPIGAMLG